MGGVGQAWRLNLPPPRDEAEGYTTVPFCTLSRCGLSICSRRPLHGHGSCFFLLVVVGQIDLVCIAFLVTRKTMRALWEVPMAGVQFAVISTLGATLP